MRMILNEKVRSQENVNLLLKWLKMEAFLKLCCDSEKRNFFAETNKL